MITTMTPVGAMPSSTRLTPTFTPPNTKSIAPQGAPALQQRQGLTEGTYNLFLKKYARLVKRAQSKNPKTSSDAQGILSLRFIKTIQYFISCLEDAEWESFSRKEKIENYLNAVADVASKNGNFRLKEEYQFRGNTGVRSAIGYYEYQKNNGKVSTPEQKQALLQKFKDLENKIKTFRTSN
jgi:hypothetical protein